MCECMVLAILLYCFWDNLLVTLIGMCVWHFGEKCQLQTTGVIDSATGLLILGYCFYCLWDKWENDLDVLQLLFLKYLQGCINSCHHLLTLTGINCCFWISLDSLPAVVDPLLASIFAWNETWAILSYCQFSTHFSILCSILWSLRLVF